MANVTVTDQQKETIARLVREKMTSQNIVLSRAKALTGLSETNLSFIRSEEEKWRGKSIDDKHWRKLAEWVGFSFESDAWQLVETPNMKRIANMCAFARKQGNAVFLVGDPGCGKSTALDTYLDQNPNNTFKIQAHSFWNRRDFIGKLRKALGIEGYNPSITESVEEVIAVLNGMHKPLLIIDEADKLKDACFDFIKAFIDETGSNCGFLLCGTPYLQKRFDKGTRILKMSYQENFSRMGGEFLPAYKVCDNSIRLICQKNGVTDKSEVKKIIQDANNDYRRVRRQIERYKLRQAVNNTSLPGLEGEAGQEPEQVNSLTEAA